MRFTLMNPKNRAVIKLTQEAIDAGNDGCTDGGHDGKLYSKCWLSCDDGYDMIFKERV